MREIRADLIKAHADRRFRSEYDYALFEYYRSAKVIAFLERAGVTLGGRVLDAGCGGGGMPLSLAEHAGEVVGIDPIDRFGQAGVVLGRERGLTDLHFLACLAWRVPAGAETGRPPVSVHCAVSFVRRRASAAVEGARAAAPAARPDPRVPDVSHAGAPGAVDA